MKRAVELRARPPCVQKSFCAYRATAAAIWETGPPPIPAAATRRNDARVGVARPPSAKPPPAKKNASEIRLGVGNWLETGAATKTETAVGTAVDIGVENGVEKGGGKRLAKKSPPGSAEGKKFHAHDFRRQFYGFAKEKIPRQIPQRFPRQFPRQFPQRFCTEVSTPLLPPRC